MESEVGQCSTLQRSSSRSPGLSSFRSLSSAWSRGFRRRPSSQGLGTGFVPRDCGLPAPRGLRGSHAVRRSPATQVKSRPEPDLDVPHTAAFIPLDAAIPVRCCRPCESSSRWTSRGRRAREPAPLGWALLICEPRQASRDISGRRQFDAARRCNRRRPAEVLHGQGVSVDRPQRT